MSYGKAVKKNFYSDGHGEIAMPPLDEKPPVLDSEEWSGNNQQEKSVEDNLSTTEDLQQIIEEQVESEEPEEIQEAPKYKNKAQEDNFRSLREAKEKAERDRDELMKYVLDMKKSEHISKPIIEKTIEEESDFDLSVEDDALIEGKHAKQLVQELKKVKQQLKQYNSKSSEIETEAKIKNQFPDFDLVVTQENISMLNSEYPEVAETLRDTKDLYSKATAAYKIMKKFGIYRDKTYDEDKMKAVKNSQKPRPLASVNPQQGDSPLSKANAFANGLNKDLQAQLLREMSEARKNL